MGPARGTFVMMLRKPRPQLERKVAENLVVREVKKRRKVLQQKEKGQCQGISAYLERHIRPKAPRSEKH